MSPRRKAKTVVPEDNIYSQLRNIPFTTKNNNSPEDAADIKNLENVVPFHFDDDEEVEYERDSGKWPQKAVELMTFHRLRLDSAFHSPKYTKNKLWDTISEYLKEANFNFDGKECHLKFRNMLATYKKNVEKVNAYGDECIKWKWFNAFHAVLQFKPQQNNGDRQPNSSTDDIKDEDPNQADDDETQMENDTVQNATANDGNLSNLSEPPENPESEFRKWGRTAVNLLLVLRHQFADIFNNPSSHKVLCWRKIAKILRESGYDVSDRDCIVKWHNLINTYRSNLRKSQTEHIRWEWFELMSKIFNHPSETGGSPRMESPPVTTVHMFPSTSAGDSNISNSAFSRRDHVDQDQDQQINHKSKNEQHSKLPTILPSEQDDDDNLSTMSDSSEIYIDDTMSLEDILNDDKPSTSDRYARKAKKYQRSYWKEKLKLQRAAEHRRKREWAERKQIELQKINLKKQKLKIYHRFTKTLEKISSSPFIRDLLANDRLAK